MRFDIGRTWPSRILVLAAALLGVVVAVPALQPGTATAVTTYTRYVSCAGSSFYPENSNIGYETIGTFRASMGGSVAFRCDPGIPHGAVVKRVRFTIADNTFAGAISGCKLARVGLQASTAGIEQTMASVPASTNMEEFQRLADTSISFATVDRGSYVYWLECVLADVNAQGLGLVGADIEFTITAAKG